MLDEFMLVKDNPVTCWLNANHYKVSQQQLNDSKALQSLQTITNIFFTELQTKSKLRMP